MGRPDFFVLFPRVGQWVRLTWWDYSYVKIKEVDWEKKVFRAGFLAPPDFASSEGFYPEVEVGRWISFSDITDTLTNFWDELRIRNHEFVLLYSEV